MNRDLLLQMSEIKFYIQDMIRYRNLDLDNNNFGTTSDYERYTLFSVWDVGSYTYE